jgi:hypothetical protein
MQIYLFSSLFICCILITLIRLLFVPVVSVVMLALGLIFYFGRILHVDLLLERVSSSAYDGRSIANWGDTDVLNDPDIEAGLELMTSPLIDKVFPFSTLPLYLSQNCGVSLNRSAST